MRANHSNKIRLKPRQDRHFDVQAFPFADHIPILGREFFVTLGNVLFKEFLDIGR
jgi:hypothetical protein